MKLPERKTLSKKKLAALIVAVLALLVIAAATYVYAFGGNLFGWTVKKEEPVSSKINYDEPTVEQKKSGEDTKKNTVDGSKPNASGSDQTPAPVPQQSGKSKVELTITAANQNGSILQIRSLIATTTGSGTCTLTLTSGAKVVVKTSSVQALPSNATCKGFDVPVSELAPGNWQAALHFENDTLAGDTTRGIVIQ